MTQQKQSNVEKFVSNPITSFLLTVASEIPLVSIGTDTIDELVTKIQHDRFNTLLDELSTGEIELTEEIIKSEEFIHSFVIIYRAVIHTYNHEKIRYFAQILRSSINKQELASDKFEEFIDILDGLSVRELRLLQLLHQFELKHPLEEDSDLNDAQITTQYWQDFTSQAQENFDFSEDILNSILVRLMRTGLYRIYIGYMGNKGDTGKTTPLFQEFSKWIKLENNDKDSQSQ